MFKSCDVDPSCMPFVDDKEGAVAMAKQFVARKDLDASDCAWLAEEAKAVGDIDTTITVKHSHTSDIMLSQCRPVCRKSAS